MPLPTHLKKYHAFTEFLLKQRDDLILDFSCAGHMLDLQQITVTVCLVWNLLAPPLTLHIWVLPYWDHSANYTWLVMLPKVPGLTQSDKGAKWGRDAECLGRVVFRDHEDSSVCPSKSCQAQSGHWRLDKTEGTTCHLGFSLKSHPKHPRGALGHVSG